MVPVGAAACGGAAGREGWAAARGTQCLRPTTPLSQTPPHSARRGDERRAASGDGDVRGAESSPARPAPDHAAARAASRCASRCLFTPLVHTSCSRLPLRLSLRLSLRLCLLIALRSCCKQLLPFGVWVDWTASWLRSHGTKITLELLPQTCITLVLLQSCLLACFLASCLDLSKPLPLALLPSNCHECLPRPIC